MLRMTAAGAFLASAALSMAVAATGGSSAGAASPLSGVSTAAPKLPSASAAAPVPPASTAALVPPSASTATPAVRLLDVPFVPQSEQLCGGAALAMVLRYWGEPRVRAEDFAALAVPGEKGIRADSLVAAARARGWLAFPMQTDEATLRDHLERGRPMIVLLDRGAPVRHFAVLLASTPEGVILHDPAVGPFREEKLEDFDRAWGAAGHWALLLLPPQGRERLTDPSKVALEEKRGAAPAPPPPDTTSLDTPVIPEVEASGATISGCDGMVAEGIRRARSGADAEAAGLLATASTLCPTSPTPVRELAGLRFREKQYDAASELAERALALDPKDTYTWKLLAGSRYMDGDVHDALDAWNRVSEPKTDLVRVDGLKRTRYEAVADQVDLPPGYLFTWNEYRHAQRRLEEIPAASRTDIELQPLARGDAQIRVAVAERPLLFDGPLDLGVAAARAVSSSEVELRVSSPLRLGEVWTASYRFQQNRPRALLALDAPALGGGPGLWHVEGAWERQAYTPSGGIHDPLVREERRRGALGYGDWLATDWRLGLLGGLDRFGAVSGGGQMFPTLGASVEVRTASDHISLTASGAGWARGGARPFQAGDVLARWGSDQFDSGDWLVDAGGSAASRGAPLALWPGAGTGTGRDPLLRAHPLLEEGIINGLVFGRRLVYANAERRLFPWEVKPVRIGLAVFLDTAKAWDPLVPRDIPWQFDVGGGIRVASLSGLGELRVDFAYGLQDQKTAVSAGLSTP